MTTSTSMKAGAKLNFVAWTDYSFFLSIDTGEFAFMIFMPNSS